MVIETFSGILAAFAVLGVIVLRERRSERSEDEA